MGGGSNEKNLLGLCLLQTDAENEVGTPRCGVLGWQDHAKWMESMAFSVRRCGERGQRSALSLPLFVNDIIPKLMALRIDGA